MTLMTLKEMVKKIGRSESSIGARLRESKLEPVIPSKHISEKVIKKDGVPGLRFIGITPRYYDYDEFMKFYIPRQAECDLTGGPTKLTESGWSSDIYHHRKIFNGTTSQLRNIQKQFKHAIEKPFIDKDKTIQENIDAIEKEIASRPQVLSGLEKKPEAQIRPKIETRIIENGASKYSIEEEEMLRIYGVKPPEEKKRGKRC